MEKIPLAWNRVSDGLPPEHKLYLIYGRWQECTKAGKLKGDYSILATARLVNGLWHRQNMFGDWTTYDSDKITYWMQLPPLPIR